LKLTNGQPFSASEDNKIFCAVTEVVEKLSLSSPKPLDLQILRLEADREAGHNSRIWLRITWHRDPLFIHTHQYELLLSILSVFTEFEGRMIPHVSSNLSIPLDLELATSASGETRAFGKSTLRMME